MAVIHDGKKYSSKKHPVLEYIFQKYYKPGVQEIHFTLADISEGYKHCDGIDEPASISNTILDLTRKDRGIASRLPESIYRLGYDLCKKTGKDSETKKNYAGTFIFVGVGNQYNTWLTWNEKPRPLIVSSQQIPSTTRSFLRNDEGALFSVIDYCDILSLAFPEFGKIQRVQNPMKWQPNEIDGFYASYQSGITYLFPVEAKALTTDDDINLIQFAGGVNTVRDKLMPFDKPTIIQPLAAKMIPNGMLLGLFNQVNPNEDFYRPELIETVCVHLYPDLHAWY